MTDRRSSASLGGVRARLAIGYGAATVRAVLVAPDGTTTILRFDGAEEMSTAAHVGAAGILIGAAARRQAATEPDGFVATPLRAGTNPIMIDGTEVEAVTLVAATLRQVLAEAHRVAGEPVDDVRLVVPAGWGPRRRTWMRHAARTAGMPLSRLIEAPVAALAARRDDGEGSGPALVIDVGAGAEVSVVQPLPDGGEVVSTLADPDAGGDRIDAVLIESLTGAEPATAASARRWTTLANITAARRALSEQVAVTVPMPEGPPAVVNSGQVGEAVRPVFERVA
jgi:molecular chaperone DnaK (HSP70)